MKTNLVRFPLLASLASSALVVTVLAQLAVPRPPPPNVDQPIELARSAPLHSLATQLATADFEQRQEFAAAFATADSSIDSRVAELRAQGLIFADEARTNLANDRDNAEQVFRALTFSTKETWATSRHNALLALRRLIGDIGSLEDSATTPRA